MDEDEKYIRDCNRKQKQEHIEAKFNLLCFAVIKRQIPLNEFFALFGQYLQARMEFWPRSNSQRIGNYPYTSKIIDRCIRKKMLPLKKNQNFINRRLGKLSHWKKGSESLEALRNEILDNASNRQ